MFDRCTIECISCVSSPERELCPLVCCVSLFGGLRNHSLAHQSELTNFSVQQFNSVAATQPTRSQEATGQSSTRARSNITLLCFGPIRDRTSTESTAGDASNTEFAMPTTQQSNSAAATAEPKSWGQAIQQYTTQKRTAPPLDPAAVTRRSYRDGLHDTQHWHEAVHPITGTYRTAEREQQMSAAERASTAAIIQESHKRGPDSHSRTKWNVVVPNQTKPYSTEVTRDDLLSGNGNCTVTKRQWNYGDREYDLINNHSRYKTTTTTAAATTTSTSATTPAAAASTNHNDSGSTATWTTPVESKSSSTSTDAK